MPASSPDQNPSASPIEQYLKGLHAKHAGFSEGQVADYIPELAKADPNWFGICIATRDGHVYEVGDTRQPFTIQSISKALTYGLALEDRGEDFMLSRVGVEPSGDAFNAISLKPGSGAPFNPMINAGAIATCGQILNQDGRSRYERILACLSAYAGRSLDMDSIVYASESETGHRNRAIGWMLRNFNIIDEEPTEILETYFKQCSIRMNCRDLAVMGATLANQGRNPLTREQAIAPAYVDNVLSVMSTCGMYDYSGEWIYRVGLPAKSGVGGGILAVLPGQLGIGIFSPLLDAQGNSARGIKVCEDLSRDLAFHLFANGAAPQPALRLSYDGSQVSSCRRRAPKFQQILRSSGHRLRVIALQGELIFSTFEPVVRFALKQAPYCQQLILNFRNVINIDEVALKLIAELHESLATSGVNLVICYVDKFIKVFRRPGMNQIALFPDDDSALEACENKLLDALVGSEWHDLKPLSLADCLLFEGFDVDELGWMDAQMEKGDAVAGDLLIRAGDPGDSLYLLLAGAVEVRLPTESGQPGKRVNVFEAGMSVGEMGFIDGSPRSANIIASENVSYRVITRELFDRLDAEHPDLKIKLLKNLSRLLAANLRRSSQEVATYKG
ncbi:MAG: glutaminase A [Rhodocyclaceae bacterium]|nr:glutaminase A [Rhodocyclaceae bacterium]MDZ4216107.1 glutaminase A [Rhodocyclaceae bacterium]